MLIVRFNKNDEIIDQEVTMENAHCVYKYCKHKYKYVEIILIDEKNNEHFVWG